MKLDRMIGILAVLLQQEKVTAPWLAEKFEVSRRTINRDIERLCMAGIPIVTSRGAGDGISIMEGYSFWSRRSFGVIWCSLEKKFEEGIWIHETNMTYSCRIFYDRISEKSRREAERTWHLIIKRNTKSFICQSASQTW